MDHIKRMEDKIPHDHLNRCKKQLLNQYLSTIKAPTKLGQRATFSIAWVSLKNPTAAIIIRERLKFFEVKVNNNIFRYCAEGISQQLNQMKKF